MATSKYQFKAAVDAWVLKAKKRQEAVLITAAQNMFEDVIWRVPVDTGFLRNSFEATFDGPVSATRPLPEGTPPGKNQGGSASFPPPEDYAAVISGMTIGQTIYGSFGANYSHHVEYGTKFTNPVGMVRLAAQNWGLHVADAIREVKNNSSDTAVNGKR